MKCEFFSLWDKVCVSVKFNSLIVVLSAVMLAVSCSKDMGNYDYTDPNMATILVVNSNAGTSNPDSFLIRQQDSLKIDIEITQTKPTGEMLVNWYLIPTSSTQGNLPQYELGSSKNLRAYVQMQPGFYQMVCKVTDQSTGNSFYKIYKLTVTTAPWGGEGWLVLQDKSATRNGNDISIILTLDGTTPGADVYHNLYSNTNGKMLPVGTNNVYVIDYASSINQQSVMFTYGFGAIQTRFTDFSDSVDLNTMFVVPPSTFNYQRILCVNQGQREMVINSNQLYFRRVNIATITNAPLMYSAPILGSWEASPYLGFAAGLTDYMVTIYDQKNRCFVHYDLQANALVPSMPDIPNQHFGAYFGTGSPHPLGPQGKGFDFNNIGKDLLYAENAQLLTYAASNGVSSWWNYFFRNPSKDSTFIFQFQVYSIGTNYSAVNNQTTGRYYLNPARCPDINAASMFAVPNHLSIPGGVFYYTAGHQIHGCVIQQPNAAQGSSAVNATLGYNFEQGTVIKVMKIFKSEYSGSTNAPFTPLPANEGRVLAVATDETANGKGHNVYFFRIGNNGALGAPMSSYGGFDKIVDLEFKKTRGL
jgi:hypothetical protein